MSAASSTSTVNPQTCQTTTTAWGEPLDSNSLSLTAGPTGPILLNDAILMDKISHFAHERIPERVVHARGAGAHGYFEVTSDAIQNYCKANFLNEVGKRTDIFIRFSTVAGERGSPDTNRDLRGFAIKFYTQEGTFDLTGLDAPVFQIRDPMLISDLVHATKKSPKSNVPDPSYLWNFISLEPNSLHAFTYAFSDMGVPNSYGNMNGFGVHTFVLVNGAGKRFLAKFEYISDSTDKKKYYTADEAEKLAGSDPDVLTRKLYDDIEKKKPLTWTAQIKVRPYVDNLPGYIYDATKVWADPKEYHIIQYGKLVLNQNPADYFKETEQSAFSPSRMVPGIEPSLDRLLHGRFFIYQLTQRHRVGVNHLQLNINNGRGHHNEEKKETVFNQQRDGPMSLHTPGANLLCPFSTMAQYARSPQPIPAVTTGRYDFDKSQDQIQIGALWNSFPADEQQRLVANLCSGLAHASAPIQQNIVTYLSGCAPTYGAAVQNYLHRMSTAALANAVPIVLGSSPGMGIRL